VFTLAQLRGAERVVSTAPTVHVTENPSIVALALRRFGRHCPPLVCTAGWPNSAAILLLRLLDRAGGRLRYHGDFDGEGIRIAAHVLARTSAAPWRMAATDYLAAVARAADGPSVGRITEAPWDGALATAMADRGLAVVEEMVADDLLDDLDAAS
jgi:uncharacterized protein (TIGR02679 family)